MNIAALISGGVDSSVVVHLLKEQGITPALFYIKIGQDNDELLHCSSEEDIEMAALIARKYGCKLEVVDLHKDYWDTVVAYTIDKVRKGLTPNPDVMCNKLIKFGVFEERYGNSFDKTATGHYATTIEVQGVDRKRILLDILTEISDKLDANIEKLCVETNDGIFTAKMNVYVSHVDTINQIYKQLKIINGVQRVARIEE